MGFSSWLQNWTRSRVSRGRTQHRPAAARFRPQLEALEDRWLPSQMSLTVTSPADDGSAGTLRAAIEAADLGSPSDKFTISFAVTGTIDLLTPLPDLNNNIAIQGPGAGSLTVEPAAGASFASAIVTVDAGQTASLSGLTVANGTAGGIYNQGTLTVANSAIVNNQSSAYHVGGDIANFGGTLTVSLSTISGNSATLSGGGIANFGGTLTVTGCSIYGNSAFAGGGIANASGLLTVTGSCIYGNSATQSGGGIDSSGDLTVNESTLSGNSAAFGGGIGNIVGTMTVSRCNFYCNSAIGGDFGGHHDAGQGGAIFNDFGETTVRDSLFSGNTADVGGAIYNYFLVGPFGTLAVRGSIFSGNSASESGGAIYNLGTATIQESTLSGNSAGSAGGGIFNGAFATLTVDDSVVLGNSAPLGADLYNLGVAILNDSTVGVIGP
jgi:predicted outer membrane repeat protein